jgi:hypothetical protein
VSAQLETPELENPYEAAARAVRVDRLVTLIEELCAPELDPYADAARIAARLRTWNLSSWDGEWQRAGRALKFRKPPSQKTVDAVIARFESRADVAGGAA